MFILTDLKYLKQAFRFGQLKYAVLHEAPLDKNKWYIEITSKDGKVEAMTSRGDLRLFSDPEVARRFCDKIGFKKMEVMW